MSHTHKYKPVQANCCNNAASASKEATIISGINLTGEGEEMKRMSVFSGGMGVCNNNNNNIYRRKIKDPTQHGDLAQSGNNLCFTLISAWQSPLWGPS